MTCFVKVLVLFHLLSAESYYSCNWIGKCDYSQYSFISSKRIIKQIMRKKVARDSFEPGYEKTGFLHMRKKRRRSASR